MSDGTGLGDPGPVADGPGPDGGVGGQGDGQAGGEGPVVTDEMVLDFIKWLGDRL